MTILGRFKEGVAPAGATWPASRLSLRLRQISVQEIQSFRKTLSQLLGSLCLTVTSRGFWAESCLSRSVPQFVADHVCFSRQKSHLKTQVRTPRSMMLLNRTPNYSNPRPNVCRRTTKATTVKAARLPLTAWTVLREATTCPSFCRDQAQGAATT